MMESRGQDAVGLGEKNQLIAHKIPKFWVVHYFFKTYLILVGGTFRHEMTLIPFI
jgi:hypothetical protein